MVPEGARNKTMLSNKSFSAAIQVWVSSTDIQTIFMSGVLFVQW